MDSDMILMIATLVIGGGGIAAYIKSIAELRKIKAESEKIRADSDTSVATTAIQIMKQTLENTVTPLNQRVDELEANGRELKAENAELKQQVKDQQKAIDEIHAEFNRLQLAFVVNESFIKSLGHEPPIKLTSLRDMSADDLRDIAMSMKNIEHRRSKRDD